MESRRQSRAKISNAKECRGSCDPAFFGHAVTGSEKLCHLSPRSRRGTSLMSALFFWPAPGANGGLRERVRARLPRTNPLRFYVVEEFLKYGEQFRFLGSAHGRYRALRIGVSLDQLFHEQARRGMLVVVTSDDHRRYRDGLDFFPDPTARGERPARPAGSAPSRYRNVPAGGKRTRPSRADPSAWGQAAGTATPSSAKSAAPRSRNFRRQTATARESRRAGSAP